jgi:DNA-binding NtrC family response regulator
MQTAVEMNKEVTGLAPETLRLLMEYPWPGNVRELQHAAERAVILTREPVLQPHVFESQRLSESHPLAQSILARVRVPGEVERLRGDAMLTPPGGIVLTTLNVEQAERELIQRALELTSDNRTKAADLLGISVRTLRNKLNARPDRDDDDSAERQEAPAPSGN